MKILINNLIIYIIKVVLLKTNNMLLFNSIYVICNIMTINSIFNKIKNN